MKIFYQPPSTSEGERFFSRYAALIPNLTVAGYLGQIVSGLTEWGILYALLFTSLTPLWPEYAVGASIAGATVGVAIIEIGLRRLLPFAARAVILKQWKGYDGGISAVVVAATVLLLGASATLSFTGSRSLVSTVATPPTLASSEAADELAVRDGAVTTAAWKKDEQDVTETYNARIEAARTYAAGATRRIQGRIAQYRTKERTSGQQYTTVIAGLERQRSDITGDRDELVAKLTEEREGALTKLRGRYRSKLDVIEGDQARSRSSIAQANEALLVDHQLTVSQHGGGLAWFTLVCLVLLVVSILVKELHHAGAGVEAHVQPDAYTFEEGPMISLYKALATRVRREVYSLVNWVERSTPEAPEPVQAAVLWKRDRPWRVEVSHLGAVRSVADAPTKSGGEEQIEEATATSSTTLPSLVQEEIEPQNNTEDEPDAFLNASPISGASTVNMEAWDTETSDTEEMQADENALTHSENPLMRRPDPITCDHCGEVYDRKRPWQRFCGKDCRKDYHTQKHNGVLYVPGAGGRHPEGVG